MFFKKDDTPFFLFPRRDGQRRNSDTWCLSEIVGGSAKYSVIAIFEKRAVNSPGGFSIANFALSVTRR